MDSQKLHLMQRCTAGREVVAVSGGWRWFGTVAFAAWDRGMMLDPLTSWQGPSRSDSTAVCAIASKRRAFGGLRFRGLQRVSWVRA